MKRCERCNKWFHDGDSAVCDPCWEDMGQMSFFHDDDAEDAALHSANIAIESVFDRDREVQGRDW